MLALVLGDRGGRAGAIVVVERARTCRADATVQRCDFPAFDVRSAVGLSTVFSEDKRCLDIPHSTVVAFEHRFPPKSLHANIALAPKQRAAE